MGGVEPFITRGDSVHLKGTVTPANGTTRVFVQRQVGRRWIDVAKGPVNASNGSYDVAVRPSQPSGYTLRVRSAEGSAWSIPIRFSVWPR